MTGALNRQLVDAIAEAVRDDADARRLLLEALGLGDATPDELGRPVAFTAATLADVLDVTPKMVLGAIGRGELAATRSGRRYVISAEAVETWLSAPTSAVPAVGRSARPGAPRRVLGQALADLEGRAA